MIQQSTEKYAFDGMPDYIQKKAEKYRNGNTDSKEREELGDEIYKAARAWGESWIK